MKIDSYAAVRQTKLAATARWTLRALMAGAAAITVAAAADGTTQAAAGASAPAKFFEAYHRPDAIPSPDDNPTTAEKVHLGKMLFFDPRLSGSGAMSCASCHNPSLGWQDGLPLGVGDKGAALGRHTPTILNLAWSGPMFWDGRAETLEAQAAGPMMSSAEMNGNASQLVAMLQSIPVYRDGLAKAYPEDGASIASAAKAIAAYERTIVSGTAPFDRWIKGDESAVSDAAKRGFALFNTKANCAACHGSWRFTDDGFHDIGLASTDLGRGKVLPGVTVLEHAFKTPTLRNIAERGPYMHDGSLPTLEAVIDHYDHGFVKRPSLSDSIYPLHLSADEKADLVAFLRTLTSHDEPVTMPALPK